MQQVVVEFYTTVSCFTRRCRICVSQLIPFQFINHFVVVVTPEAARFALHSTAALFARLSVATSSVPKQIILTCIRSTVQRIHSPYFTTGNVSYISSYSSLYLCRSLQISAPFPRQVLWTRDFNLGVMDTSWERSNCTSIGYLPFSQLLSINVTQVHGISHVESRLDVYVRYLPNNIYHFQSASLSKLTR